MKATTRMKARISRCGNVPAVTPELRTWSGTYRLTAAAVVAERTVVGVAGPWSERLPHFRIDSPPSNGDEIQSEYFIDRGRGAAALDALRRLSPAIAPLLLVSEIRATAPDRLWLSGSYDREALALHFTWRNQPDLVSAAVTEVEAALAPFGARPHWGKLTHIQAGQPEVLYPRLGDARALFERLDPAGVFSNHRLERLGVRERR
jgi:xylitol oxidase